MSREDEIRALADAIDAAPSAHEAAREVRERFAIQLIGQPENGHDGLVWLSKAALARLVRDMATYPFASPPADAEIDPSEVP